MTTAPTNEDAVRIARLEHSRGRGFTSAASLYCDLHRDSASWAHYQRWMTGKGGKIFGPLATFDQTIQQFRENRIDAIKASAVTLVRFAQALGNSVKFKHIAVTPGRCTPTQSRVIRAALGDNLYAVYSHPQVSAICLATGDQIEAGNVGKFLPDVEHQIVVGVLQVRTPMLAVKVVNNDASLTSANFVDGWFVTGDRASLVNGELVLTGRK